MKPSTAAISVLSSSQNQQTSTPCPPPAPPGLCGVSDRSAGDRLPHCQLAPCQEPHCTDLLSRQAAAVSTSPTAHRTLVGLLSILLRPQLLEGTFGGPLGGLCPLSSSHSCGSCLSLSLREGLRSGYKVPGLVGYPQGIAAGFAFLFLALGLSSSGPGCPGTPSPSRRAL